MCFFFEEGVIEARTESMITTTCHHPLSSPLPFPYPHAKTSLGPLQGPSPAREIAVFGTNERERRENCMRGQVSCTRCTSLNNSKKKRRRREEGYKFLGEKKNTRTCTKKPSPRSPSSFLLPLWHLLGSQKNPNKEEER